MTSFLYHSWMSPIGRISWGAPPMSWFGSPLTANGSYAAGGPAECRLNHYAGTMRIGQLGKPHHTVQSASNACLATFVGNLMQAILSHFCKIG